MTRDEFLSKHWFRYPPESGSDIGFTQDCAGFLAQITMSTGSESWIGGRLKLSPTRPGFDLASGGASFPVDFDDAEWSETCLKTVGDGERPVFHPSLLREGDLVSIKAKGRPPQVRAVSVRLLFATQDPSWKEGPSAKFVNEFAPRVAERWQLFTKLTREFFSARGFLEARTPTLVPSPGTEPFLDPFVTHAVYGSRAQTVFLPTSPEFHLKKLLCMDMTRLFELKTCFRNNEGGSHHQPEFLMLEWYRAYCGLEPIIGDAKELISFLWNALGRGEPLTFRRASMAGLFKDILGFELTPRTSREDLARLADSMGLATDSSDTWDDIFFRIFIEKIEPRMAVQGLWIVEDYPPSQAALARINERGWADRFEIYWNGLEIANAFHELNDPEANRERFAKDAEARGALGKPPVLHDEELVNALYRGMPPSGGIALGMDRLFMALTGIREIEKTRAFPFRA